MGQDHDDWLSLVQVEVVLPEAPGAPAVVHLRGELDLAGLRSVDAGLAPVVDGPGCDVIVDLTDLHFIDVGGMNLLARTAEALQAAGRVLRLRAASPILLRMMAVTGIDQRLEVVDAA